MVLGLQFPTFGQTAQEKPDIDFKSRLASQRINFSQIAVLEGHIQDVSLIEFGDGVIASVEPDAIIIWRGASNAIDRVLPGHYASEIKMSVAPTAIAFSPDSQFLATATWSQGLLNPDRSIVVWEIATGKRVLSLRGDTGCKQVVFAPEGNILYTACGMGVQAWDFPSGEKLFDFDTKYPNEAIALSPDGKVMATVDANVTGGQQGEESNIIQLWQLETKEATLLDTTLSGHDNDIAKLEFTSNGRKLVSSSYDGKIKVWDWEEGTENSYVSNLYSDRGIFSLSGNNRLIAGNFGSFSMANLATGLPYTAPSLFKNITPSAIAFSSSSSESQLFAWAGFPAKSANPIISLSQEEKDIGEKIEDSLATSRKDYVSISLAKYWGKNERVKTNKQSPDKNLKSPVGKDIEAMALDVFGLTERVENEEEKVEILDNISPMRAVIITQTNLADDSVSAIRYRVEFAPYDSDKKELWRVVWTGKQYKCQANRGDRDWSKNLCN